MSVTWTLTREQLATKALKKCQALGVDETASPDDLGLAVDAIDAILKELPIYGYAWPKMVSGQASLSLVAATQATTLPADYFGQPLITYPDASGNEVELELVSLERWNEIPNKSLAGTYPLIGFIDRLNVLRTWPVQSATLAAKLVYQQVIDDTASNTATNLSSIWLRGLVYGVCSEIGDEFGCSDKDIVRWGQMWVEKRALCIANQTFPAPDRMTVSD